MKQFTHGGLVSRSESVRRVVFDRGWWKCKKCGAIFEDYTSPPTLHICHEEGGSEGKNIVRQRG